MSAIGTTRPATEQRLGSEHRKLVRAGCRAEAARERASEEAEEARGALAKARKAANLKFGREVPPDALLLDVLELIDVEDGDRWLWRGRRNNKNLATFRIDYGREASVVRYLAVEFGLIEPDAWGLLYPIDGDSDDVNPWHRTFRPTAKPLGNPSRYTFNEPPS